MNDAHAAHLLPVHHFTEAVLLTSHSTRTFRHQLPSSTTPSACSDLDSAMVAHRDLRAIRRDDTFPWAIGHGTLPQRHMDNPFVFIAQVTAWIHFTAVPISPAISDTNGLSCHLNDMKVSACPCDSDVSMVIPLPNEGIGSTTTSSTAAYMKRWRNPGAFTGRVNSTTM
ncbi:hypothetical protein HPB51_024427 [Rhipicephalus microplus]|uniref:Uncharacterized protein n=1 Tax=Rhipicephalus microplus TaxID=6941 RepID=A0A9J6E594_RHIMP|nr:hypothetical protein HPB51_024427 [Rhipicephalus microplus]